MTNPTSHPRELYVLFFTEMWERFGYYLMIALFVLYLNEHLGMSQAAASSFVGTYMGLAYLAPLLGGFLADRLLGHRFSVLLGALTMAVGYFLLASGQSSTLYLAVGVLVIGNGLFKPNISALVGGLYPLGDARRDSAFGIFYFGVNLGAAASGPVGGYLRSTYGWGPAFAAAGVGLLIGFVVFALFGRGIVEKVRAVAASSGAAPSGAPQKEPQGEVRERLRALFISCAIVTFFWIAFQQNATTLTFWARDNTDLTLGGLRSTPLDPVYFASVNSIFILLLTPVLLGVFGYLRRRGNEPSTPGKIVIGMALTGVAYGIMTLASLAGGDGGRVSAGWLVSAYFVITIGELCVSPMGLSMVTRLAPRGRTALLLGVWYLATAFGNKTAGEVGRVWPSWSHHNFFLIFAAVSVAAGAVLWVQLPRLVLAMDPGAQKRVRSRDSGKVEAVWATAATSE